MANKDLDFEVLVGAVADESSADSAIKDLLKKLRKKLKDGYVKVPAEIKFGENASKELKEARDDFQKKWESLAKKGFFTDSTKITKKNRQELELFLKSFQKLTRMTKSESQRESKGWRDNLKGEKGGIGSLKALEASLREVARDIRKENKKLEKAQKEAQSAIEEISTTKPTPTKPKQTKSERKKNNAGTKSGKQGVKGYSRKGRTNKVRTTSQVRQYNEGDWANELSYDEAMDIIAQGMLQKNKSDNRRWFKKLHGRSSRNDSIPNSGNDEVGHGYRQPSPFDNVWTTKRSVSLSNWSGPYGGKRPPEMVASALVRFIDKKLASQGSKRNFDRKDSKIQKNVNYDKIASTSNKMMKGDTDVNISDLERSIAKAITTELIDSNLINIQDALNKGLNTVADNIAKRFEDHGIIGVKYGEEGSEKGVGVNYEKWKESMKQIMNGLSEINLTALESVFNHTRERLANAVQDIITQEKNVKNTMKELEKQIADNKLAIGKETYSREKIVNKLGKSESEIENIKKQLKTLRTTRTKTEKKRETYRADYEEGKKHERPYLAASEAERELYKKYHDNMSPEEKANFNAKLEKIDAEKKAHPYYELIANFDKANEKLHNLDKKIATLEDSLQSENRHMNMYKETLEKIDNETKEETKTRLEHIALLEKENEQLKQEMKTYQELLDSLKVDENDAQIKLYDSKNYKGVEDLLRSSLIPLVTRTLVTEDATGQVEDHQLDTLDNTQKTTQDVADISERDANTGGSADKNFNKELSNTQDINTTLKKLAALINKGNDNKCPCEQVLQNILTEIQGINQNGITVKGKKDTSKQSKKRINDSTEKNLLPVPFIKSDWIYPYQFGKDVYGNKVIHGGQEYSTTAQDRAVEDFRPTTNFGLSEIQERAKYIQAVNKATLNQIDTEQMNLFESRAKYTEFPRSEIVTSLKDPAKWYIRLKDNLAELIGVTAQYKKVLAATSDEQDKLAAEQISRYGRQRGGDTVTSDKIMAARSMSLWRDIDGFKKLFGSLKVTDGIKIDTTEVTDKMAKVLTGRQWRNAQMGGSPLRQVAGYFTAFAGMPSIEKSRATAEAFNQINATIRDALNSTIATIEEKESVLAGMKERGELILDDKGNVLEGSTPEAEMLVAELESVKITMDSILADIDMVNETIDDTHGNIGKIMKRLHFTSSALRKNNAIVNNINAGYDKNGKALKFQTRTAEILNYTFQLMSRHLGQMLKSLLWSINPINLIRRAISDFMGYNVKWQRTMNVIKYNIRSILKPFMDWLAQSLVNVIGFIDIISQRIQKAFGKIPVSVFDQSAAQTEKMKEDMEAITNIAAGFDEFHDIGSDNSAANDLLGEIYKPQLSQEWIDFATKLGDIFGKLFHGDMGLGEALGSLWEALKDFAKDLLPKIGDWIDKNVWPLIRDHWAEILGGLFAAFLTWKLLSVGGTLIAKALFGGLGKLATTLLGGLGTKIGGWFGKLFGANSAVGKHMASSGTTLGQLFATKLYTGMGKTPATVTLGKFLGGIALTTGGTALAITQATKLGKSWQDLNTTQKALGVGLTGLGSAAAGVGAVMLGATGPVGWAVAGAVALTSLAVGMAQTQDGLKGLEEETKALHEAQQNAQIANENYLTSLDNLTITTENLERIERETGLSGKLLAEQVKNGELTIESMTSAQLKCYNAYVKNEEMIKQNKKAIEEKTEAEKQAVIQSLRVEIENAKESGSYDTLKQHIIEAYKNGSLSAEECRDITERAMAGMSSASRKTFQEDLPRDITNGLNPTSYASGWEKFKTNFGNLMGDLISAAQRAGQRIGNALSGKGWKTDAELSAETHTIKIKSIDQANQELDNIATDTTMTKQEKLDRIEEIRKRMASLAVGTNYVPNDGFAYLHQGEAVIPKKYNQPYQQGMSIEERAYMQQMISTMRSLDDTIKSGIPVNGEFKQRGSDLVAVVNRTKSQTGADLLSNVSYAR